MNFRRHIAALVLISFNITAAASEYVPVTKGDAPQVQGGTSAVYPEVPNCYEIHDPLESFNRRAFKVNFLIFKVVINPTVSMYQKFIPKYVRNRVDSIGQNLRLPLSFMNNLIQVNKNEAGNTLARFMTNSTLGLLGLFDVASGFGLDSKTQTFTDTLAHYNPLYGSYLVIPLVGPSSTRDASAMVLNFLADPLSLVLKFNDQDAYNNYAKSIVYLGTVIEYKEFMNTFAVPSMDPYNATRSAYIQYTAGRSPACKAQSQVDYSEE
jgi:phospholipid-binding lipoprotein MlaA